MIIDSCTYRNRQANAARSRSMESCLSLTGLATLIVVAPLIWIIAYVIQTGCQLSTLDFFTQLPTPVGVPGGGIVNALVGSLITVGHGRADRCAGGSAGRHLCGHAARTQPLGCCCVLARM